MFNSIFQNKSIEEYFRDLILEKGQVSIDEIYRLSSLADHKQSCVERKLRKLSSPKNPARQIEPIVNLKGYIVGYRKLNNQKNLL